MGPVVATVIAGLLAAAWWWRRDWRIPHEQYDAYIQSAAWRRRKRRWYAAHPLWLRWCRVCWSRRTDLHHRRYRRLGHEWNRDLVPLCREHHGALHQMQHARGWTVDRASNVYLRRLRPTLMMAAPTGVVLVAGLAAAAQVSRIV